MLSTYSYNSHDNIINDELNFSQESLNFKTNFTNKNLKKNKEMKVIVQRNPIDYKISREKKRILNRIN